MAERTLRPAAEREPFRIECIECHGVGGIEVPGVGYSLKR